MNKAELFQLINVARGRLDSAIASVPSDQMETPAIYGVWSVKDLMAHIAAWDRFALELYEALQSGVPPRYHFDSVPIDALNEEIVAASRQRSLAEVREEYVQTHGAVLRMIEEAPDAALFDGDHWPDTRGTTYERWLASNTYEHYDEHLPDVIGFVQRMQSE